VLPGENADQLPEVFLGLPSQITSQVQEVELSFAFSAAGRGWSCWQSGCRWPGTGSPSHPLGQGCIYT
jgi:hypothetical protein